MFVDISAIVKHAEMTKLILLEINSRQQNTLLSKGGFRLIKQNNVSENDFCRKETEEKQFDDSRPRVLYEKSASFLSIKGYASTQN